VNAGERAPIAARKTVLVVDDEPTNIELIRMITEEADLPIDLAIARNGWEAIEQTKAVAPVLILMDLKMPVLDGWEATRRLKADPATAAVPVIALTAQAMAGDRDRALAAGCDGYLTKPVELGALLALLRGRLL
jgi:CheY-like chemotaxis protein